MGNSSPRDDRELARLYGGAGVANYWLVNLVDRRLEVYTDPSPTGYRTCRVFRVCEDVEVVIDGVERGRIAVSDLMS